MHTYITSRLTLAKNPGAKRPFNVYKIHYLTTALRLYHVCYWHGWVIKSDRIPDSTPLQFRVRRLPIKRLLNPIQSLTRDFLISPYNKRALNPDFLYV